MVKMNTSETGFGPNIDEISHSITTDLAMKLRNVA